MEDLDKKRIIELIKSNKLTAYESFKIGIELNNSNSYEIISELIDAFEDKIRNLEIAKGKQKRISAIEKGLLSFLRTAFYLSKSSLDIGRGINAKNALYEGQSNFAKEIGIKDFRTQEFTEYSVQINIEVIDDSIIDKMMLGEVKNFALTVSNDSGNDDIEVFSDNFDFVYLYSIRNLSEDNFDSIEQNLDLINNIQIGDYNSFITICKAIGNTDKEWLKKQIFLSTIANDGGKTLARLISDK